MSVIFGYFIVRLDMRGFEQMSVCCESGLWNISSLIDWPRDVGVSTRSLVQLDDSVLITIINISC